MNENQEINQLKSNLQNLARKNPQQEVSYENLFSPTFMQKYTDFASINFFIQNAKAKNFAEFTAMDQKKLDEFVKNNSHFKTWEEMQTAAVNNYMSQLF